MKMLQQRLALPMQATMVDCSLFFGTAALQSKTGAMTAFQCQCCHAMPCCAMPPTSWNYFVAKLALPCNTEN